MNVFLPHTPGEHERLAALLAALATEADPEELSELAGAVESGGSYVELYRLSVYETTPEGRLVLDGDGVPVRQTWYYAELDEVWTGRGTALVLTGRPVLPATYVEAALAGRDGDDRRVFVVGRGDRVEVLPVETTPFRTRFSFRELHPSLA